MNWHEKKRETLLLGLYAGLINIIYHFWTHIWLTGHLVTPHLKLMFQVWTSWYIAVGGDTCRSQREAAAAEMLEVCSGDPVNVQIGVVEAGFQRGLRFFWCWKLVWEWMASRTRGLIAQHFAQFGSRGTWRCLPIWCCTSTSLGLEDDFDQFEGASVSLCGYIMRINCVPNKNHDSKIYKDCTSLYVVSFWILTAGGDIFERFTHAAKCAQWLGLSGKKITKITMITIQ